MRMAFTSRCASKPATTSRLRSSVVSSCPPRLYLALARKLQHWRQQRGRQKSNRFKLAKQQLCTVVHHAFLNICRRYTSVTWNFQISCFMEDGNTRQRFSSVLCLSGELRYSLSEFNSSKNHQPKTNQRSWNKSGKLFETARILFVGRSV